MALRARFFIMAEAAPDGKTNVINVKRMQLEGQDEIYAFPEDKQALTLHHSVLLTNSSVKSIKKVLTSRNSYRNPFVKLTPEIMETYLDDAGNPFFNDGLLRRTRFHSKKNLRLRIHITPPLRLNVLSTSLRNCQKSRYHQSRKISFSKNLTDPTEIP